VKINTEKMKSIADTMKAVEANTERMKDIGELNRQENLTMVDTTKAAKRANEAMKIIAIMTMIFLPETFFAVCIHGPLNLWFWALRSLSRLSSVWASLTSTLVKGEVEI
jgi:hypothetical protein